MTLHSLVWVFKKLPLGGDYPITGPPTDHSAFSAIGCCKWQDLGQEGLISGPGQLSHD